MLTKVASLRNSMASLVVNKGQRCRGVAASGVCSKKEHGPPWPGPIDLVSFKSSLSRRQFPPDDPAAN